MLQTAINDNAAALVPAYIQQFRPNFPTGWTERNSVLGYLQLSIMSPGYVPKMVFLDPKGIIRAQYEGQNPFFVEADQDKNIRAELDKLLKDYPPAGTRRPAASKKAKK